MLLEVRADQLIPHMNNIVEVSIYILIENTWLKSCKLQFPQERSICKALCTDIESKEY